MPLSPTYGFLLAVIGLLFIYCEFLRPGVVIPGLLGASALVVGAHSLWQHAPSPLGLLLYAAAALLFFANCFWNTYWVAPLAALTACIAGTLLLFPDPPRIAPSVGWFASLLLGVATNFLGTRARQARLNKRADLG